jgi:DNA polymerase-4
MANARDRSAELSPAILLVDMDSFFASVEVLDNPALSGMPVLVGGDGKRGVVASANYEARRFGIHSAMPMANALRRCPDAVCVPGNMARYAEVSGQVHEIFASVTPIIEPLALDEAFLDVSGSIRLLGSPLEIGHAIRLRIKQELALDCGIGVASSKQVAKLASRSAKPRIERDRVVPGPGVFVVLDEDVRPYLNPMPVRALFGVGPTTATKLSKLGIETVADLADLDPSMLERHVGGSVAHLIVDLANGRDTRPVEAGVKNRSIGHEETFAHDSYDLADLDQRLIRQAHAVANALRSSGQEGATVTVKIKLANFEQHTRSVTLEEGLDDPQAIYEVASGLLATHDIGGGVRLLGISLSALRPRGGPRQLHLRLDDPTVADPLVTQEDRGALLDALDEIKRRFGKEAVGTANLLSADGVISPGQRDIAFGAKDLTPPKEADD